MKEFFFGIDKALYSFINGTLSNPVLDLVMRFFSAWPWPGILMLITFAVLLPRYRSQLILPFLLSAIAVGISDGLAGMIKDIVMRERPFLVLPSVNTPETSSSFSFPSAHASNTFAFAVGMYYYLRKPALAFIIIAAIVSFSRVYLGVHYVSDVIGGALLGAGSFFMVNTIFKKIKELLMENRAAGYFFLLLVLSIPLRLLYLKYGHLDLIGDEAHYWEWTRRLDLSYYSKGPVIAWIIAFTTWIGGNNAVAVRFLAPFLLFFSSFFIYKLTVDQFHDKTAGALAGALILTIPLFAVFGVIMTIDGPFLFLWCLALWTFWRAIALEKPGYWYLTGALIGLGFMTKYIMLLFYPCALIFLFLSKRDRPLLKTVHPWLSAVLGTLVLSPVIIWNARNGWVTFLHTAGHANLEGGFTISLSRFFDFFFSQIGILTPLFVVLAFVLIIKFRNSFPEMDREKTFLLSFSLPILAFFLLKSLQGKVEANWAMVAYPSLVLLVSWYVVKGWSGFNRRFRIFTAASLLFIAPLSIIMHFPFSLPLPQDINPATRLAGWQELGEEASKVYDEMEKEGPLFVFSNSYTIASELAFYMKGHPVTYCAQLGRRMNQYDLWPGFENLIGYNALYVPSRNGEIPQILRDKFERYESTMITLTTRQGIIREFTLVRFYKFKGGHFPESSTY